MKKYACTTNEEPVGCCHPLTFQYIDSREIAVYSDECYPCSYETKEVCGFNILRYHIFN